MSIKCKAPSKKHDPVDSDNELDIIGQTLKDTVLLSSPSKYKATSGRSGLTAIAVCQRVAVHCPRGPGFKSLAWQVP